MRVGDDRHFALQETLAGTDPKGDGVALRAVGGDIEPPEGDVNVHKDIDNIQAIYQMCRYYLEHRDLIDTEDYYQWLLQVDDVETNIGHNICRNVILQNEEFRDILPEELLK